MSVTDRTISEMERTIHALIAYRDVAKDDLETGPLHAAALRATMDTTRQLAIFRRTSNLFRRGHGPK